jgi:hypothetical protein
MTGIVDFRTELLDENGNPITALNPLPTTGGGGGGGGSLSDTVFVDSTGQLFVYRDTGTGTPTAYSIPAWTSYSPVAPISAPGGGAGGGTLSDTVFVDSTGQIFVYRDTGLGVPTAYAIPAWTVYTPSGAVTQSGASEETQQDMVLLLTRMLNYFNAPQGYDKSLQRYRQTAVIESGTVTAVTTVTTVGAVTTLNNYEAYMARMQVLDTNRTAWAQCVRARIT